MLVSVVFMSKKVTKVNEVLKKDYSKLEDFYYFLVLSSLLNFHYLDEPQMILKIYVFKIDYHLNRI